MAQAKKKKADSTIFVPPVIEHSDWNASEDRVPLFTISRPIVDSEGEPTGETNDKTYDMPAKPHPGLGLGFLRMVRFEGVEVSLAWLLEECVGTEGFLALTAEPNLDNGVLKGIMNRARDVVLGKLESPKAQ